MSFLPFVKLWLWVSVLASLAGWTLSALGQLNRVGYVVFAAVVGLLFLMGRKLFGGQASSDSPRRSSRLNWKKFRRRFHRFLPGSFAALACLVFIGGGVYTPNKHTFPSHRTPRGLGCAGRRYQQSVATPRRCT